MIALLSILGYITGYVVCLFILHCFGLKLGFTDYDNYNGYYPDFKSNASCYASYSLLSWVGVVVFIITIISISIAKVLSRLGTFLISFSYRI